MTEVTSNALRVSRTIRATPERLFRAWTDPAQLSQWWRMDGPGWSFAFAEIDLRIGGAYRLAMTDPEGRTHVAVGLYREIVHPTRLAFTWEWEDPASRVGQTKVTVDFIARGDGITDVVITHEGFDDAARVMNHERGWLQLLGLIDQYAIGSDG